MRDAGSRPAPSPWFERWREAWLAAAHFGPLLDLACGRGRHARITAAAGCATLALDRSAPALAALADASGPLHRVRADLETGHRVPVASGTCGAVLVFRYLHRPLAAEIERCLAPGGLLLYETFTQRQAAEPTGPSNPAFLLSESELPTLFPSLHTDAYEEPDPTPNAPEWLARLAAHKPPST